MTVNRHNLQMKDGVRIFSRGVFALMSILIAMSQTGCQDNTHDPLTTVNSHVNSNGRNDLWGYVGPGGGGAMFNPAINPLDHENVFVSCDMTGSFVTYDAGNQWRMFNLRGVTRFYEFDPSSAETVYAGTSNLLFKSTDKGRSWNTIYPEPANIVAIHAQGDHAQETVVTRDSIITEIKKLVVDPDQPQNLYLLIKRIKYDSWPKSKRSRFYMEIITSSNGGKDWQVLDKLRFDLDNLFIEPSSPVENRTLYISGKDGLGVRENGRWRNIALPEPPNSITQFADGFDPENQQHLIYVITGKSYFNNTSKQDSSRIYLTRDGGDTWTRQDLSLTGLKMETAKDPEFRSIAVSYHHPQHIYISYAQLQLSEDTVSFGVAKSSDYGDSWQLVWDDRYVNHDDSSFATIASNRASGWLDKRFGPGWGENPFHMAVARDNPDVCFATDFGRTLKSTDGGSTWQQVYTKEKSGPAWQSTGLQVTTGYMLSFDPFDEHHVFMAETDVGLMESFDGGISWSSATYNNGVPRHWVNSTYWIVFDPKVKNKLWAVMSANHDLPRPKMWRYLDPEDYRGGVVVSQDGGKNWHTSSSDIGEAAVTHILLDPYSNPEARTLYVCAFGKGVYKSVDGGKSWHQKNKGIEQEQPFAWRMYFGAGNSLYLVVARRSDDGSIGSTLDGSLYRSVDGAESWQKMNLPAHVNGPTSLQVDVSDSSRIYLSAWGRYGQGVYSPDRGGGIFVTEDEGQTWKTLMSHDQHIHDLTQDPRNGVLYACGFNSSAYRSEHRGEYWQRIRGYNFKWGKRVQPDPSTPDSVYIITFGGGTWYGPAKGDLNAVEDIMTDATRNY